MIHKHYRTVFPGVIALLAIACVVLSSVLISHRLQGGIAADPTTMKSRETSGFRPIRNKYIRQNKHDVLRERINPFTREKIQQSRRKLRIKDYEVEQALLHRAARELVTEKPNEDQPDIPEHCAHLKGRRFFKCFGQYERDRAVYVRQMADEEIKKEKRIPRWTRLKQK